MPTRHDPGSFICKGCEQTIARLPSPARDKRTMYCSTACQMRVWWETHQRIQTCRECSATFTGHGRYCSNICKGEAYRRRPIKSAKKRTPLSCVVCETAFFGLPFRKVCSPTCGKVWQSRQVKGKAYRKIERTCATCRLVFLAAHARQLHCQECGRRRSIRRGREKQKQLGLRTHGKHEKRAKRAGVPYVYGIKPSRVFHRDGYTCHLCGCPTPKHLKGKNRPNSPELDHIVPLSRGGSHTWDNVACSCRACNSRKGNELLGQFRLQLDKSNTINELAGAIKC